jgi:hypothetical protein
VRRDFLLPTDRFESIAERKLRGRQLTEDGNVEISGRDLVPDDGGADRPRASQFDPKPPFASIDSNAGKCPTLAIAPNWLGRFERKKTRPFTLNAAAIR